VPHTASTAADTNQRPRPHAGPSSTAAEPADRTRRPHPATNRTTPTSPVLESPPDAGGVSWLN
jgi:hypothetical protein